MNGQASTIDLNDVFGVQDLLAPSVAITTEQACVDLFGVYQR